MASSTLPSISINAVIDDQHAVLLENIDRLERAMAAGDGAGALPQILHELRDFARYHFPTEERLMASYNYPLREMHAMEHRKGLIQLREIERMASEGQATVALELLFRLRAWHARHLMEWDAQMGEFLNRRCVA